MRIVIVGAGFGGIGAGIELQRAGFHDIATARWDHSYELTGKRIAGVRTADGALHAADCLIWATGFASHDFMFPMAISGRGGIGLREAWKDGAHAWRSTAGWCAD